MIIFLAIAYATLTPVIEGPFSFPSFPLPNSQVRVEVPVTPVERRFVIGCRLQRLAKDQAFLLIEDGNAARTVLQAPTIGNDVRLVLLARSGEIVGVARPEERSPVPAHASTMVVRAQAGDGLVLGAHITVPDRLYSLVRWWTGKHFQGGSPPCDSPSSAVPAKSESLTP
jgi:hypothetical protein